MQVRHRMSKQVEVVRPEDDVESVRKRLRERRVRQFPVLSAGKLVGIVTDRDVRSEREPQTKVENIMTPAPMTISPETPIEEAAAVMRAHKMGALPVTEAGKLVGIISESDLLQALVELCQVLEPTTLINVECEEGSAVLQRIRALIEGRGGQVPFMSVDRGGGGRQRVALRVRTPVGQAPEQILEEAGFAVLSVITGRSAQTPPRT